jgi:protein gp37
MIKSKIEWTQNTYNPITKKGGGFYCFKVSPACTNCYAEKMARRIAAMQHGDFLPYANMKQFPELELKRGMLQGWAKKRDAKMNFVSSMTDVFGEFVPDEWVFEILDAMRAAPRQTFQVLSKRAMRAHNLIHAWLKLHALHELPDNIWIGFSTENQQMFSERVLWLIDIPAKTRFISCEPLLSNINMWPYLQMTIDARTGKPGSLIDWVIVGGESGNKKTIRPMLTMYAQHIRNQCKGAGVPFFFKQFGEWVEYDQLHEELKKTLHSGKSRWKIQNFEFGDYVFTFHRVGKRSAGASLDGKEYKEFPI